MQQDSDLHRAVTVRVFTPCVRVHNKLVFSPKFNNSNKKSPVFAGWKIGASKKGPPSGKKIGGNIGALVEGRRLGARLGVCWRRAGAALSSHTHYAQFCHTDLSVIGSSAVCAVGGR